MPIDPAILFQLHAPFDPTEYAARNEQLRSMQNGNILQGLTIKEKQRALQDKNNMEAAATAAYQPPAPVTTQQPPIQLGGTTLPGAQSTVQGPAQFDRAKFLSTLAQTNPLDAMGMGSQFAANDLNQQKEQLGIAQQVQGMHKNDLEMALTKIKTANQQLGSVLALPPEMRPQGYAQVVQGLKQNGLLDPNHPEQYPGDEAIKGELAQTMSAEQIFKQENDKRDFAYKQQQGQLAQQNRQQQLDLTKRGQDITLRGQNLVDARSKEANQAKFGDQPLTPDQQDLVDQIGQGKMPLTRLDYLATRNPGLLAAVSARYPEFDGSKIKSYVDTTKDFTSGKTATQINAGGTALGHLQELRELNTAASHIPHTAAWTAYQNKADTVATELARFYGDATIPAIQSIKNTLTSTLPGNREAAITTQAQSMGDKFDSFEQQWRNAAPSAKYQAEIPGMSLKAKVARAKLDPNFAASATVTMQAPDGTVKPVPIDQVDHFKSLGAKVK